MRPLNIGQGIPIGNGGTFADNQYLFAISGSGAITYNASRTVAEISSSGAAGDAALIRRAIPMVRGEVLTVTFEAAVDSGEIYCGTDVRTGRTTGNIQGETVATSPHWQAYSFSCAADTVGNGELSYIYIGARTARAGVGKIRNLRFFVSNSGLGVPRELAKCMIRVIGGEGAGEYTVDAFNRWPQIGIKSLTRVSATRMDVELDWPVADILSASFNAGQRARPFVWTQMTSDNRRFLEARPVNWFNPATDRNAFSIEIINGGAATDANTTANLLDMDAFLGVFYFFLKVEF